jgi:hypothetical protein
VLIYYRKVKKIENLTSGELVGLVVPHPPDLREHTQEARLDRHPGHRDSSVVGLIPRVIIFSQESCLRLARNNCGKLDLMRGELGLGNNIPDPAHHEETALDRGIEEVGDVVTIAQITPVSTRNALGCSDVGLVTSGAGGLGHRKLINTGDVPEAIVDTARLGVHKGVAEVIGRGQENVPLGSAEETLVTREVAGMDLLATHEVKISDVIVDLVGDVGRVHHVGRLVALVALKVIVLFGDEYGVWPAYMLIWLPGTNDKQSQIT